MTLTTRAALLTKQGIEGPFATSKPLEIVDATTGFHKMSEEP